MSKRLTKKSGAVIIGVLIAALVLACLYAPMRIPYCLLPSGAAEFIESRFPATDCLYAERDYEDGVMEYEVKLANGVELEFSSSGDWKKVDCGYSMLPAGIVPHALEADVRSRFPEAGIYSVERARGGYEVKIAGGMELIYSADGTFVRLDY